MKDEIDRNISSRVSIMEPSGQLPVAGQSQIERLSMAAEAHAN